MHQGNLLPGILPWHLLADQCLVAGSGPSDRPYSYQCSSHTFSILLLDLLTMTTLANQSGYSIYSMNFSSKSFSTSALMTFCLFMAKVRFLCFTGLASGLTFRQCFTVLESCPCMSSSPHAKTSWYCELHQSLYLLILARGSFRFGVSCPNDQHRAQLLWSSLPFGNGFRQVCLNLSNSMLSVCRLPLGSGSALFLFPFSVSTYTPGPSQDLPTWLFGRFSNRPSFLWSPSPWGTLTLGGVWTLRLETVS